MEEQRGEFGNPLLVVPLEEMIELTLFADQRESTRQYSREGSEERARCVSVEHVSRWVWQRNVNS